MSTPLLGRNARLYKDGVVIGYGKNISVKASAELIKEYSMDALTPAIVAPGKQSFKWSAEKLYIDGSFMTLLLAGTERNTLTRNAPEKRGSPRVCKISSTLIGMLQALPKKNDLIFGGVSSKHAQVCFKHSRRILSKKLKNPRLAKIHFHLIRHWFGTMQYHKKPDIVHVQQLLGHRNVLATQIYINLEQALFKDANDEYHVKVAETVEQATK